MRLQFNTSIVNAANLNLGEQLYLSYHIFQVDSMSIKVNLFTPSIVHSRYSLACKPTVQPSTMQPTTLKPYQPNIEWGNDVTYKEMHSNFPFIVQLHRGAIGSDLRCGGTLIDDLHIVTASHCFYSNTTTR